jgi:tetratricopeptide (TPR) repeat protein
MINKLITALLIFVFTGFILPTWGMAQSPDITDLPDDAHIIEQQAFDLVFVDPDNPALNIDLAKIQLRYGNYKAAIGSLERILISNPSDANAQFLLMQIYMLTGNHIDARRYANRIRVSELATNEQISTAEQIIARMDTENRPFLFSGFQSLGGGIDDNPEGGSKSNRALIGNIIGTLDKQAQAEEFLTTSLMLDLTARLENQSQSQIQIRLLQHLRDYSHYNDGDLSSTGIVANYMHPFAAMRFDASG